MKITKDTFKQLSTLKKYNVEFQSTPYNYKERVCISTNGTGYADVFYYFEVSNYGTGKEYVSFIKRYSMNTGKGSRSFTAGYNFEKRIVRDLQKANLI
jgi:hypothetical protein